MSFVLDVVGGVSNPGDDSAQFGGLLKDAQDASLELSGRLGAAKALWALDSVKAEYNHRRAVADNFASNAPHLIMRSEELCSENFVPTVADVLHSRESNALQEAELSVTSTYKHAVRMKILDPGGQRSLRRKW